MVIYFHNKHTEPLEAALLVALHNTSGPPEQLDAVRAALGAIQREKECAPYQLWLKSHSTQEKTS